MVLASELNLQKYGISNNEEFITWLSNELGIITHPNLRIGESEKGGLGLFYKIDDPEQLEKDFIIFRIPAKSTLDIYTCLDLKLQIRDLEEKSQIEDDKDGLPSENEILQYCLTYYSSGNVSHTRILLSFLCGFLICKRLRPLRKSDFESPLSKFDNYLDILLNTKIGTIYKDDEILLEKYSELFPGNIPFRVAFGEFQDTDCYEFASEISKELVDSSIYKNVITGDEVNQLKSAIRSRVSEIPRANSSSLLKNANDGQEEEEVEDEEEDEDYFVVNSTLVPFMDFANHCNANINAFFDVDRKTSDVLLKIDCDTTYIKKLRDDIEKGEISKEYEFEVLISYAPTVDINKFFFTYGFIPVGEATVKLFEIPFFGFFEFENHENVCEALNDLQITPNLQFIVLFDKEDKLESVGINLRDNYCEFLLKDGFKLQDYIDKHKDNENEEDESGLIEEIIEDVKDKVEFDKLSLKLLSLIKNYSIIQLKKLNFFQKMAISWDTEQNKNILNYVQFQIEFYEKYINQYDLVITKIENLKNVDSEKDDEEKSKLIDTLRLTDDEIEDDWLEFRVPFIYNIYSSDLEKKFSSLNLD